jgi:hypothetical protein
VKAPAETPLTALALAELAHQAEIPAGVFNIITTQSATPEIGKALCESEDVRKLSFTGSVCPPFFPCFSLQNKIKKIEPPSSLFDDRTKSSICRQGSASFS